MYIFLELATFLGDLKNYIFRDYADKLQESRQRWYVRVHVRRNEGELPTKLEILWII